MCVCVCMHACLLLPALRSFMCRQSGLVPVEGRGALEVFLRTDLGEVAPSLRVVIIMVDISSTASERVKLARFEV